MFLLINGVIGIYVNDVNYVENRSLTSLPLRLTELDS